MVMCARWSRRCGKRRRFIDGKDECRDEPCPRDFCNHGEFVLCFFVTQTCVRPTYCYFLLERSPRTRMHFLMFVSSVRQQLTELSSLLIVLVRYYFMANWQAWNGRSFAFLCGCGVLPACVLSQDFAPRFCDDAPGQFEQMQCHTKLLRLP